jgi:hypothetical protein
MHKIHGQLRDERFKGEREDAKKDAKNSIPGLNFAPTDGNDIFTFSSSCLPETTERPDNSSFALSAVLG